MRKYFALVKLMFVQQYKARPAGLAGKNGRKRVGTVFAFLLIAACFLPMLVSIAVAMYYLGNISEGNAYVGTFLTLMCQGLVLMFGIHAIISNVFVVRDADKLLYLPVRAHTIFLAKLTVAYLNEVITTAATALFVLLPFGIGAQVGATYYLMMVCALMLVPLLPLLLGCIVSMPFSALIARFGNNSAIKTVLRIFIYIVIMAVYLYGMNSFGFLAGNANGNILDNPQAYISEMLDGFVESISPVMPYFHPNYMLMNSMLATNFVDWLVPFAIALAENIGLLAIVFLVSMPFYRRMLVLSVEDRSARPNKNGGKRYQVRNKGVVRELMVSDFKRTVRDGQLGFQSFAGMIMMPIVVVVLYFFMGTTDDGSASFLQQMADSHLYQMIAPLFIMAYMIFIGLTTNVLGLYPISRENKSVYMLKSLPVSFSKILLAKVLLATAVMMLSDFVTCALIVVLLDVSWYYGIAMMVVMSLVGFGSMCITTLLDLKDPRFGWENFSQGLKNAKNSWIAMLIGFLAVIVIVSLSSAFIIWYSFTQTFYAIISMWGVIFVATAIFAGIAYKTMTSKATRYFESIEI
ncbi:MAG: ABC transporter permease [Clostridiales bacterium]|nr:ABC transporter permease [Clostridiales bacterium]